MAQYRFPKGVSGNPGGRPKGALTNSQLVEAMVAAICEITRKEDRHEAIKKFVATGYKARKIRANEILQIIVKALPKEISGPNGGPIKTDDQSVARLFTAFKERSTEKKDPLG
jgi:hypothetical protein